MAILFVIMNMVENELGVRNVIVLFVLFLGVMINMSGNVIYYGLVVVFFV